ncbi:trans-sialidase, partial [Trypanosoma conorhini]
MFYCSPPPPPDNDNDNELSAPLAQPATSTWCQSLVLSIREEAKRLLLACLVWARSRRIAAGPEGHEMEPCVGLPEERSFFPLPTSIGACQRCVCRLRTVCDAQRQKLLLSGDVEQNPGPLAVLQMNVSALSQVKLATLMAYGADIIAVQETWRSPEQLATYNT